MSDLDDVKVGDVVANRYRLSCREVTVTKVTATRIVCGDGSFLKRNGALVGADAWTVSFIEKWDESMHRPLVEQANRNSKRRIVSSFNFAAATDEQIAEIYDILKATTGDNQ